MIGLLVATLLTADVGTADAGFEPIVLDVAYGNLFLHTADGGTSDAPVRVKSGTFMDDDTTLWVSKNKARARAEAAVGPEVDKGTLWLVGVVMYVIGVVSGGAILGGVIYAVLK